MIVMMRVILRLLPTLSAAFCPCAPCYPSAWLSPIHDYQMIGPRLMPAVSKQTFISRLLNTMSQISLTGKLWPGCLISEALCRGWKYNLCPGRYLASIMTRHLAHTGHAGAAQTQAQCCQAQGRGPHSIDSCDIFHFGILCSILSQNVYV